MATSNIYDVLKEHLTASEIENLEFKYYNISELDEIYKKQSDNINLSIFHINIRSLHKNSDKLLEFIHSNACAFDVYILTEIWAGNIEFYKNLLPGYTFYYKLPISSRAGGVSCYVKNCFNVTVPEQLQVSDNDNFELICIELIKDNNKYTICGVYRHPGTPVDEFVNGLSSIIYKISPSCKFSLVGDCNIDLKHYSTCNSTKTYVDEMLSYNLLPLVTLPTRITPTSETIIDHVFSNFTDKLQHKSGIITTDFTDHMANFLFIIKPEPPNLKNRPLIRVYSQKNFQKFYMNLEEVNWESVYNESDVSIAYDKFYAIYYNVFNKSFPLIRASKKWMKNKSWVTPALYVSLQTKAKLYKEWLSNKTLETRKLYDDYANVLGKLIKIAKDKYNSLLFNDRCNNIKQLWNNINKTFSMKSTNKSSKINELNYNNSTLHNKIDICNAFSEYFSTVGKNLADKIPPSTKSYQSYLPKSISQSIFINELTYEDLHLAISSLKNSKTPGPDNINNYIIKLSVNYIAVPLLHIYNLSIKDGVFPESLKIAKICPIYKQGDKKLCSNYRPIAITCAFSKIYEKILYQKLMSFLNKNNLIYEYQFGFRKNYSTSLALMEVINMINNECVNNYVLGIFIDLQKAFDTVCHEILLKKIYNMGIRGNVFNLIKSYLTNRRIFTKIDNHCSGEFTIEYGVPQGATLSSLLFLLYINDFHNATKHKLRLFADDSNIFIISNNIVELYKEANETLSSISEWLNANLLSLNVSKTNYIIFKLSDRNKEYIKSGNLQLTIDSKIILQKSTTKYLGMLINENIDWKNHVDELNKKLRSYNGIFYKYRTVLPAGTAKNLYFSYVYSRLTYGIELYGSSTKTVLHPLEITCNKLLRTLQNAPFRYPTKNLYINYNTLPITELFKLKLANIMHKCVHNPATIPIVIRKKLTFNKNIHNHNTRRCNDFHYYHSSVSKDPLILAIHIWNELSTNFKIDANNNKFLRNVRKYLQK